MKLQQLAVIFVIIVVPISLVLSMYTNKNTEVLRTQAEYNSILLNATNDAVNAYQMNTLRNGYSTINDSKIRDISASVNSFFNSLASGMGSSGYRKEDLEGYIPALLFTLYDGYYLYGDYQNVVSISDGMQNYSTSNSNELSSQTGVKPFIYYTCEYRGYGKFDIIINYTLDNYITVMGTNSSGEIFNRSGYLIDPSGVDASSINEQAGTLIAHGVQIEPELLGEYLVAVDTVPRANGQTGTEYASREPEYFQYVYYNNQKYYIDTEYNSSSNEDNPNRISSTYTTASNGQGINFFRLNNNLRVYLTEGEANGLANYLGLSDWTQMNVDNFLDRSAFKYYRDAYNFSNDFINLVSGQNLEVVTESYNNQFNYTTIEEETGEQIPVHEHATYDINDVFDITADGNDPELESSLFNEHRIDVIISSIESNLMSIIANFNIHHNSGFEFALPVLSETDWYTIANNITIVSFMQGLPIENYKYYSNYSIVANTKNKEFISRDSIILRERETGTRSNDTNGTYHNPRCLTLNNENSNNLVGYSIVDYQQQLTSYDEIDPSSYEETTLTFYYYPHSGSGAYECVIGREEILFSTDNLIEGTGFHSTNDAYLDEGQSNYEGAIPGNNIRKAYITALAREKYNLYKVSDYFNNYN